MPQMIRVAFPVLAFCLLASACNRSEEVVPVTTLPPPTTAIAVAPATTVPPQEDVAAPEPAELREIPSYQIVSLVPSDAGDELVVLLDPGDYDDVDIELLMAHLVDEHGPEAAHVIDDAEAAELVLDPAADMTIGLLANHYFAKLESGNKVTYMGPLAEFGIFYIGS